MRVARSCRRAGADVSQAQYYRDPETEKFREVDLVAVFASDDIEPYYNVVLVIECEAAIPDGDRGEKPWLVFSTDLEYGPGLFVHSYLPRSEAGFEFDLKYLMGVTDGSVAYDRELRLLRGPDRVGYGLVRMRDKDQGDRSYGTVISLVKAAEAQGRQADDGLGFGSCTIVIPLLVVDGELLDCSLPEQGDSVTIDRVDRSVMFFKNPAGRETPTFVYVVRADALDAFLTDVVDLTHHLRTEMRRLVPVERLVELRRAKLPPAPGQPSADDEDTPQAAPSD
jgi:hypothetical protein